MAPTVCVAEVPTAGTTLCTYSRRQQRSRNDVRRRALVPERMRAGTAVSSSSSCENQRLECTDKVPHCSIPDKSRTLSPSADEHFRRLIATRKDLLSIVVRTIILVRHNCILQKRVNALRAETRGFLRSVMNDPGTQSQQAGLEPPRSQDEIVSPTAEKVVAASSSPALGPDFG